MKEIVNEASLFEPDLSAQIEIEYLDSLDSLKVEIDQGFESAMQEMESIQSDLDNFNGHDLIVLCKENVIGTVVGQFGLASLLIDSRDGGAVTTTHNFDKGITSTTSDKAKYEQMRESRAMTGNEWKEHRKQSGYDRDFAEKRKDAFQERSVLHDEYTGRSLPKNGRTHLDHVVSAREIDTNAGMNLHLSKEERVQSALKDDNLAFTSDSINASKNDHKMEDWIDKKSAAKSKKTTSDTVLIEKGAGSRQTGKKIPQSRSRHRSSQKIHQ